MSYQEHEKHIKSSLQNYSPELDTEELWGAVAHAMPQRKRRMPIWIFWVTGLLIFGGIGLYINMDSEKSSTFHIVNKNNVLNTEIKQLTSKNQPKNNVTTDTKIAPANTNTNTPIANNIKSTKHTSYSIIKNDKSTAISATHNRAQNIGEQNLEAQYIVTQDIVTQNNLNANTTQTKNIVQDVNVNQEALESTTKAASASPTSLNNAAVVHESTQFNPTITDQSNIAKIQLEKLVINPHLLAYELGLPILEAQQIIIPVKEKNSTKWSIGLMAGVAHVSGTLESKTIDNDNSITAELNNKYTQDLPAFSSRIVVTYGISDRLSLLTGLSYTLAARRIILQDFNTTTSVVNGVTEILIDDEGNETNTLSSYTNYTTTAYDSQWHSYFETYSIPLGISYDLLHYQDLSVGIGAGIRLDLLHRDQGAIISPSYDLNKYTVSDSYYERSMSIGYSLQLPIQYQISNRWTIAMNAEFQTFEHKINNDLSLRQYSTGVVIGAQYRLSK